MCLDDFGVFITINLIYLRLDSAPDVPDLTPRGGGHRKINVASPEDRGRDCLQSRIVDHSDILSGTFIKYYYNPINVKINGGVLI